MILILKHCFHGLFFFILLQFFLTQCLLNNDDENSNIELNKIKDSNNKYIIRKDYENDKNEKNKYEDPKLLNKNEYKTKDDKEINESNSSKTNFTNDFIDSAPLFNPEDDVDDNHQMKLNAIREETFDLPQINYASKECLAKVLYANDEVINKEAVLNERDSNFYLRNPCHITKKFLIIELCEYIKLSIFEIVNYEIFSSNPKAIRLSVSNLYPVTEWTVIAEFAAEDTHEIQRFPIPASETFIKFVKVEFLSHYGTEYYCTISFIRIFGISKVDSIENENHLFANSNEANGVLQNKKNSETEEFGLKVPPSLQHLLDCFQCSPTSTCQNTRNYAAKECGANVLFANLEAVNKEGVLYDKDVDFYLRNPCEKAQDKFLILRLCESVQPTKLEIANYEYFSSGPKNIRLSVSKTYPTNEWTVVGEFEVHNTKEVQCFSMFPIGSYVKFVKLELLSHYGSEYYCTLSFVRIYGISKNDEFGDDEPANVSRIKDNRTNLEEEVYVLKWIVGLLISIFVIYTLNYFC